ncbi:hypothetical protein HKD37_07G020232 [Glycine soja]
MPSSVKVNHGGNFIRNPILKYVGGEKALLLDIDEDKWSFFELIGILKDDVNYKGDFNLWWTGVHDVGLKELALDNDALELANFSLTLDDGDEVVGVEVVVSEFDSSDTESNESGSESGFDNDNEGVVFEDSEEEREIRVNDGFDSEDEFLVNLVSKKKCRKASCVGSSGFEFDEDKHKFVRYRKSKVEILSSRLVLKIAAKKLKSNDDVKLTHIMDVVRLKYGIGITLVVAWEARMIAKARMDGDAVR